MSAFGGKADIAAKLITKDEARRIEVANQSRNVIASHLSPGDTRQVVDGHGSWRVPWRAGSSGFSMQNGRRKSISRLEFSAGPSNSLACSTTSGPGPSSSLNTERIRPVAIYWHRQKGMR
jgi:hypothetical protein